VFNFALILLLLSSCVTRPKPTKVATPHFYVQLEEQRLPNQLRWKEQGNIQVSDLSDHVKRYEFFIENYFTSSLDPYTGKESIPQECLLQNLPKKSVFETENEYFSVQYIYTTSNYLIGCHDKNKIRTLSIFLYCKKKSTAYSILGQLDVSDNKWPQQLSIICLP
jgi:hypothetical protein